MANARPLPQRMTTDEFVRWAETRPEGERWELIDGEPVAMAPERLGHARAKLRALQALQAAIAARGLACEAFIDGVAVRVDDRSTYEPDALVRCGEPLDDDTLLVADPVVVVEVASPSTGKADLTTKLEGYLRIPSLRHFLIVNAGRRSVIHHARDATGRITTSILQPPAALDLDPPGLTVSLAALFG